MGLGSFNSGANGTYLTIGMGKDAKGRDCAIIGRRAQKGDKGAVQVFKADGTPVTNKKTGEDVYRTEHPYVEGLVTQIARDENEYGKRLNIHMNAEGENFILQLERGDHYWVDFAHRSDSIDFAKPVRFQPYSIPRDNNPKKHNKMLVAYQGGKKVEKVKFAEIWDGGSHAPYLNEDEGKWMFGKRDRFLDDGPIQRAIDKVEFLAGKFNDIEDEITNDPPVAYQAPIAADDDAPKHIVGDGDEDDLPF